MDHHQKIVLEETTGGVGSNLPENSSKIIASSIILGAVIISATIYFTGNLFIKNNSSLTLQNIQAIPSQQAQQQAAAAKPTGPVSIKDRGDEPVLGNKNAKVTIVEFSDFQCPFCQNFFKNTYPQLKAKYIDTGKVKLVFRHFPLPFHANAQISGVAAECANRQGKFWEYHDVLFNKGQADGTGLDKASLEKYASELGLNNGSFGFGKNKFNQCLSDNSTLEAVQSDTTEGSRVGVTGTPTFYINGVQLVGAQPITAFETAIEAALSADK